MRIASAISDVAPPARLAEHLAVQLESSRTQPVDLLMVYITQPLQHHFVEIITHLRAALRPRHLLAVTGESVLGADQELERVPAASAMILQLPGVTVETFHFSDDDWAELIGNQAALRSKLDQDDLRGFVMFADLYTTPAIQLLESCSRVFPQAPIIGGMASGASQAGETRLAADDHIHSSGLVGVSFSGNLEMDCIVSQGCRPIGPAFTVTRCHRNVVEELDGRPALQGIEELVSSLDPANRQLLSTGGLQVGRVVDEDKGHFGRGDYLIRSLVGIRRDSGAILIGDLVSAGQTLQFHVRDAKAADEELRLLLEGETFLASPPAAALLFSCVSRGTRLFDAPHHDIAMTRRVLGKIPTAGFFAAGEFGPVGGKNFIHGHTASLGLIRTPGS